MNTITLVQEFHDKFKVATEPKESVYALRKELILEEAKEFAKAIDSGNRKEQLDALLDLQYVLDGSFIALGFNTIDGIKMHSACIPLIKNAAFIEVHRSNMSKLGPDGEPIYREDGKILKGPNYSPPNLERFL